MRDVLNISEAKAQLSAIVERVSTTGQPVILARAGKPLAKVVRYEPSQTPRRLGFYKKTIVIPEDFDQWPGDVARALGIADD